jgi:hypothetical protein
VDYGKFAGPTEAKSDKCYCVYQPIQRNRMSKLDERRYNL